MGSRLVDGSVEDTCTFSGVLFLSLPIKSDTKPADTKGFEMVRFKGFDSSTPTEVFRGFWRAKPSTATPDDVRGTLERSTDVLSDLPDFSASQMDSGNRKSRSVSGLTKSIESESSCLIGLGNIMYGGSGVKGLADDSIGEISMSVTSRLDEMEVGVFVELSRTAIMAGTPVGEKMGELGALLH